MSKRRQLWLSLGLVATGFAMVILGAQLRSAPTIVKAMLIFGGLMLSFVTAASVVIVALRRSPSRRATAPVAVRTSRAGRSYCSAPMSDAGSLGRGRHPAPTLEAMPNKRFQRTAQRLPLSSTVRLNQ